MGYKIKLYGVNHQLRHVRLEALYWSYEPVGNRGSRGTEWGVARNLSSDHWHQQTEQKRRGWLFSSRHFVQIVLLFFFVLYTRYQTIPVTHQLMVKCRCAVQKNTTTRNPYNFFFLSLSRVIEKQMKAWVCKVPLFFFFFFSHTGNLLWLFQSSLVHCTWGVVFFWVKHKQ